MVVLSSTTPFPALLGGFDALRTPRTITLTVGLLWRYLHVFGEEFQRLRRASAVRGYQPRWLWQAGVIAACIGTMFVRSYERGERVHQAMLARGYDGTMPATLRMPQLLRTTDLVFAAGLAAVVAALRMLA
jgi:cobalt/nickel transport system permease protein